MFVCLGCFLFSLFSESLHICSFSSLKFFKYYILVISKNVSLKHNLCSSWTLVCNIHCNIHCSETLSCNRRIPSLSFSHPFFTNLDNNFICTLVVSCDGLSIYQVVIHNYIFTIPEIQHDLST